MAWSIIFFYSSTLTLTVTDNQIKMFKKNNLESKYNYTFALNSTCRFSNHSRLKFKLPYSAYRTPWIVPKQYLTQIPSIQFISRIVIKYATQGFLVLNNIPAMMEYNNEFDSINCLQNFVLIRTVFHADRSPPCCHEKCVA